MLPPRSAPTCPSSINAPSLSRSIFRLTRQSRASSFHQPKAVFAKEPHPKNTLSDDSNRDRGCVRRCALGWVLRYLCITGSLCHCTVPGEGSYRQTLTYPVYISLYVSMYHWKSVSLYSTWRGIGRTVPHRPCLHVTICIYVLCYGIYVSLYVSMYHWKSVSLYST